MIVVHRRLRIIQVLLIHKLYIGVMSHPCKYFYKRGFRINFEIIK